MTLINWLCEMGEKLRIVHVTHEPAPAPAPLERIPLKTILLKDLVAEIQSQDVHSLAQQPQDVLDGFEHIFEVAGIHPPGHGWTVEKLRDMLGLDPYKTMDRAAAQKAIIERFTAEKVPVEDLITDAISRDKALDAFEQTARAKMRQRQDDRQLQLARLQSQIDDLRKQYEQLEHQGQSEQEQWRRWHDRKVDFEKEMARTIGYLLDRAVVTVDVDGP